MKKINFFILTLISIALNAQQTGSFRTYQKMLVDELRNQNSDVGEVNYILKLGALANVANDKGETPLIIAAKSGNTALVKLLLNFDIDLDAQDDDGNTALMHAAVGKFVDIVRLLVGNGASVEIENDKGLTASDLLGGE